MKKIIEEIEGTLALKICDGGGQGHAMPYKWFITKNGGDPYNSWADDPLNLHEKTSFDRPINTGDKLTVFKDAASDAVEWKGTVKLDPKKGSLSFMVTPEIGRPYQSVLTVDQGFPKENEKEWANMFLLNRRAKLVTTSYEP